MMIEFFKDVFSKFWNSPNSMNFLTRINLITPVLFLIVFLFSWFVSQPSFYLKYLILDISSNDAQHIEIEELKKLVTRKLNGTALTTDLTPIYNSVVSHPWVKEATVRRIWPNKILVSLREHNIVGVWSDGRFVTQEGELLEFDQIQSDSIKNEKKCLLLQLDGPSETVKAVLKKARMISKKASSTGFQATGVQLSTQYDWRVFFSNGMKMKLGGENLATPIEERLDNFFNSAKWISKNIKKDLVSVDLRYAQGFAFEEKRTSNVKTKNSNLKSCVEKNVSKEVVL